MVTGLSPQDERPEGTFQLFKSLYCLLYVGPQEPAALRGLAFCFTAITFLLGDGKKASPGLWLCIFI